MNNTVLKLLVLAFFLALLVVLLGAYTRLTDAGLGCPDWPGCYGRVVLPSNAHALQKAQTLYPQLPIETRKAWTEMIHRYAAGSLALFILWIGLHIFRHRFNYDKKTRSLILALLALVIFQAALGMWTVTLKLLPVVVMAHLVGGMFIVACLSRLFMQISTEDRELSEFQPWIRLGLCILLFQIVLGGWVSSNYAGIACIGFPTCNGMWLVNLHFAKSFNIFSMIGANHQGGLLDNEIRMSIHFIHRIWALLTVIYIIGLALFIRVRAQKNPLKIACTLLLALVVIQFILGIMNVLYLLPITIAVAHNGVAALLLATIFSMLTFIQTSSNADKAKGLHCINTDTSHVL